MAFVALFVVAVMDNDDDDDADDDNESSDPRSEPGNGCCNRQCADRGSLPDEHGTTRGP